MNSLFPDPPETDASPSADAPLAERLRPATLDALVGQTHLIGEGTPLRRAIEADRIGSMILWGPPGVGKTTLARVISSVTRASFQSFSAVLSGVRELRQVMADAERLRRSGRRTILFVDEIHRFNKAQQDGFLPWVENGTITLIGATTENPSFHVNRALLSRVRVYVLEPLSEADLGQLIRRAGEHLGVEVSDEARSALVRLANGDARSALNILELAARAAATDAPITGERVREAAQRQVLPADRDGEEHFNLISALHKSIRNSDADAGLYWLGRMLGAGEDPLYLARRLVRIASEDIGVADPEALRRALDARDAVHFLGMPEGALALAQAVIQLAAAPKSNSVYRAWQEVEAELAAGPAEPVPIHLRNAPTDLMKSLDYGKDYRYAHDEPEGVAEMECLPARLSGHRFYRGLAVGSETELLRRLEEARRKRG